MVSVLVVPVEVPDEVGRAKDGRVAEDAEEPDGRWRPTTQERMQLHNCITLWGGCPPPGFPERDFACRDTLLGA